MSSNNNDRPEELLERIQRTAASESLRLQGDPNIYGVGFGIKRTGGELVEGLCLRYIVRKKLPDEAALASVGSEPIPESVDGFPTDVIEADIAKPDDNGPPTGDRGSRKEDPLVGGTSTTVLSDWHSFPTGFGTLGGICFDSVTNDAMALSNAHVWGLDTGKDVIQPWMPTEEYLTAVVELLACGPVISHLIEGVVPSPLTVGLSAAAAGAWVAAAASDTEDPNRWGQRATGAPPAGARTDFERVHLAATVPARPFPGLPYTTKTSWDFTRDTTAGSFNDHIEQERQNEHLLVSKRVWTDRTTYHGGDRVRICAEIVSDTMPYDSGYFLVAHSFPTDHQDRMVSRILSPGQCKTPPAETERCFHGFPPPAAPDQSAQFPITVDIFRLEASAPGRHEGPWPPGGQGVTTLLIPWQGLTVRTPPASSVTLEVFHGSGPVEAKAYDASSQLVDSDVTSDEQGVLHKLQLTGSNIVRVVVSGGNGEGFLVGACASVAEFSDEEHERGKYHHHYLGYLDLPVNEPADRWGVVLFVQTVDNLPPGVDPLKAAETIGGITVSANVADLDGCTCVLLTDHVFDVV